MATKNENLTASVSLEVSLDRLPDMVKSLLTEEGNQLVRIVQKFNEHIIVPLTEAEDDPVDIPLTIENIDDLRQIMAKVDMQLAQYSSLLRGYFQQTNELLMPTPQPAPADSAEIQQQMDQAANFNEFVEKINDDETEEDEEPAG